MKLMGNRRLQINVSISGSVTSQNIRTLAGSPAVACDVTCTVNAGANVHSTNSATPALRVGAGWVAGTTIKIINNGSVQGEGGGGGAGGGVGSDGSPGGAGSSAIDLDGFATSIDNTNGYIFAGGGGGGGGGGFAFTPGGNGGIGQGFSGANEAGEAPNGGAGGPWGIDGQDGGDTGAPADGGAGGGGGLSVRKQGGTLIWLGGNNSSQVKGAQV